MDTLILCVTGVITLVLCVIAYGCYLIYKVEVSKTVPAQAENTVPRPTYSMDDTVHIQCLAGMHMILTDMMLLHDNKVDLPAYHKLKHEIEIDYQQLTGESAPWE